MCFFVVQIHQSRSNAFKRFALITGSLSSRIIFVKSLLRHYTMNTLSNSSKLSHKAFMVPLYRFEYIKSYRCFLFHLYRERKLYFEGWIHLFVRHASTDHMINGYCKRDGLTLSLKDSQYKDSSACLGSINN